MRSWRLSVGLSAGRDQVLQPPECRAPVLCKRGLSVCFFTEFIQSVTHPTRGASRRPTASAAQTCQRFPACLSYPTELTASECAELEVHRSSEAQLRKACDACQLDQ
jgi:hypothetical protein